MARVGEADCASAPGISSAKIGKKRRVTRTLWLQFQRDIPAQLVKYLIKPYPYEGYGLRAQTFHGTNSAFVKEKNGFYSTTMTNMPALKEEPQMPPEDQVRTWMLIYYTRENKLVPDKF